MRKQWVGKIAIVLGMVLFVLQYYFQTFEYNYILIGLGVVLCLMGGFLVSGDSPKKETKI
ncbi:hypothetical protein ABE237_26630 [Brevibacillus formosus]|uniref:hypothetical protein n=1 Tax=Brevibacillus TaxID=55080 RepID=UPI000D10DE5D|nr:MULTISPECIES: hypothetical protein [Brevibacillus]MBG9940802.1 hypothetical protein [Brevibacillus formosus]MED1943337.1 hypothetical protein [Brevibacillus formosus]MED2000291.1 hypothetical protein [Brevibacillus formosus]MED2082944.1 hypothetical protein [Brevibacillus formosus]PSK17345.1 hypothetical protein C7R94_15005 [Brevibacillus sp. NRRL NRS-603]